MNKFVLIQLLLFLAVLLKAQTDINEIRYIPPSPKPSFESMLAGVNTAYIINGPNLKAKVVEGLVEYLKEMGFDEVITLDDVVDITRKDMVCVAPIVDLDGLSRVRFYYYPLLYLWDFRLKFTRKDLSYFGYNWRSAAYEILRRAYGYKKPLYNKNMELRLAKWKTRWNRQLIINDFGQNGILPIEGIYENSTVTKYTVAVKNMNGTLRLIYLSGADNPEDWDEGEIKATLIPTATQYFYKANWIMAHKTENDGVYISFEQGVMNVIHADKSKDLYIKMYPPANSNTFIAQSSGTGFAITSGGLIVTNNHVVNGARSIKVRGVNGDFNRTYSAQVVIADKNNDLAIIRINDRNFTGLGTIPFVIKPNSSTAGENIFVLGYPLRAAMGDEIKLTNGVISSRTGYQGDITSYQISAPIQPGNSGGPLFDSQGNLTGIINAKLAGAENASYGVKASYLSNLINSLERVPDLQRTSHVAGKPLPQQVSILRRFVFIIEVN